MVDESSDGEVLWRLAHSLGGRAHDEDRAQWILTQARWGQRRSDGGSTWARSSRTTRY